MILVPKQHDSATILREHQESDCNAHLLPPVQSVAVPCTHCKRSHRVVQTCPGCSNVYCLRHRHGFDHDCSKLKEIKGLEQKAQEEIEQKKAAIANTFGTTKNVKAKGEDDEEQKAEEAKARAEAAKAAIALAKANVEARKSGATPATPSAKTGPSAGSTPKVTASRIVTVTKLKKIAQGEDKVPISSRIYVSIRSPLFPQFNDKAVYMDKTWTVGRTLDKIISWLKIAVPKNEPFDAQKRFSIFHAKEIDDTPILLDMQDRVSAVKSGDIFHLALADWEGIA
ncbi:hypothetical protein BGX31_008643 [Mortierella sp. GBA43]|nr:hypothetical protein BGX31_008643 [Mortierella sp. GBA43]